MQRALWSVSAVVAIFVTACASAATTQPGGSGQPGSSGVASAALTPGDPLRLVGLWQLDAPGQHAGSVLRLGDDLSIWSGCGYLFGDWSADPAGLFAGYASSGSAACVGNDSGGDPTPKWLTQVVSFKADAAGAQLLDATGAVVATLHPGGHPTAGPDVAAELAQQPTLTDNLRARLRAAAPLPAGLVAARPDQLVGRWISTATPTLRGFAELAPDGSWKGSDGANNQGGRWSAAPDGELVMASGAQTTMGCVAGACADVASWFWAASRAAFDGPTLVLLDADGKETGRAIRTPTATPETTPPSSPSSVGVASDPITSQSPGTSASTCSSFSLSLVSNTGGQPSPVAAAEWFARHGQLAGTPAGGWHVVSQGTAEASVQSGAVVLHVIEGPDQTWQVDSGQHCP